MPRSTFPTAGSERKSAVPFTRDHFHCTGWFTTMVIQFWVSGRLPPKSGREQICYFSDTSSMLQVKIRNLENVFCHSKYENFLTHWSSQMWSVVIAINVIFKNVLTMKDINILKILHDSVNQHLTNNQCTILYKII